MDDALWDELESDGTVQATKTMEESLGELSDLANKSADLSRELEAAEARVEEIKKQKAEIDTRQIPTIMDLIGLEKVTTTSGATVTVSSKIHASLPKDSRRAAAMAWIREHGGESLVKHEVKATFGKGEDEAATELAAELMRRGLRYSDEQTIHPSTYAAWLKELKENGTEIPFDEIGAYEARVAKVKI